jgi:hypothetical protein
MDGRREEHVAAAALQRTIGTTKKPAMALTTIRR